MSDENTTTAIELVIHGTLPSIIANYDECKALYAAKLASYATVVMDDKIQDAKKDLAELRAEVKRLNRIRIDETKRLSAPISEMGEKVAALATIVQATIDGIAAQVEKYERQEREWCRAEMARELAQQYETLGVRNEFQTGDFAQHVGLNKRTKVGKLVAASTRLIELMAKECRGQQDKIDGRVARLEADCAAAGIQPMTREHVAGFLMESDEAYSRKLAALIAIDVKRAKDAEEKARERIAAEEKAKAKKEAEAAAIIERENAAKAKRVTDEADRLEAERRAEETARIVNIANAAAQAAEPEAGAVVHPAPVPGPIPPAARETSNTGMFGRPMPTEKPAVVDVIVMMQFMVTAKRPINDVAILSYFRGKADAMKLGSDIMQTLVLSVSEKK
jgi:hypothetical protein